MRRALPLAVLLALMLAAACTSTAPAGDDDDPKERQFAIVVHGSGESSSSATYNVSIANVSKDTFDVRSVSIVPVQQLPLYPLPYTSRFVLEPGQERSLITELRTLRGTANEWPDEVYVDVTFVRHGNATESHRERLFVTR
jgi:hypothetical protein